MSHIAIRADNLSKVYHIGARVGRYATLRDQLAETLSAPFRRRTNTADDTIWALKEVSFEIRQGEAVGIIGRNGAGKSTLLKILSRITEPTVGRARIHGRVGSLLEVGTGFHPELTGRENIFMAGATLGMRKAEIERRFDDIVAFSEIEKFVDTPVKRYSSGMFVRLAFAVAAHLEPEILIMDEVLAVGDAAFQKKCLGKMGDVAQDGRTVLFVSHNMGQIKRLCTRGLWLTGGECGFDGPVDDAIAAYQGSLSALPQTSDPTSVGHDEHTRLRNGFLSWRIVDSPTGEPRVIRGQGALTIEVTLHLQQPVLNGHHGLVLQTADGKNVAGWGINGLQLKPGRHTLKYSFRDLPLRPGIYYWYASLWDPHKVDVVVFPQELIMATPDHSILTEEWAGILNLPCEIQVDAAGGKEPRFEDSCTLPT